MRQTTSRTASRTGPKTTSQRLVPPPPARPRRSAAPRLRAVFLRQFRACGEVGLAAEQSGTARSTLYRWRRHDAAFRQRWDDIAEQRRQLAEDRLVRLVREGERTAVFHKGQQVGWRESHTARPAIALLAYMDRREKARLAELKRNEDPDSVSHFEDHDLAENDASSTAWQDDIPRKTGNAQEEESDRPDHVGPDQAEIAAAPDAEPAPEPDLMDKEWEAYMERTAIAAGHGDAVAVRREKRRLAQAAEPASQPRAPTGDVPLTTAQKRILLSRRQLMAQEEERPPGPYMLKDDWRPYE